MAAAERRHPRPPGRVGSLTDAKARLSEVVEGIETEHRRVVITKHGRPSVVVLVLAVEDLEALEDTLDGRDEVTPGTPGGRTPAFHLSQVAGQAMATYSNCATGANTPIDLILASDQGNRELSSPPPMTRETATTDRSGAVVPDP